MLKNILDVANPLVLRCVNDLIANIILIDVSEPIVHQVPHKNAQKMQNFASEICGLAPAVNSSGTDSFEFPYKCADGMKDFSTPILHVFESHSS